MLALDRKIKHSFNFAMSPFGELDFGLENLDFFPLSVISDPINPTETALCFQFGASSYLHS